MPKQNNTHAVSTDVVIEFLQNALPFSKLSPQALKNLARHCIIDFFPAGETIFRQGETKVNFLYLIQQGGVKSYLINDEDEMTLKDYRGVGEYFGALPLIQESPANLTIETVEDTFCFLIDKENFLAMLKDNQEVTQFFLRSMSTKMVKNIYSELRHHKMSPRNEGALYLFSAQVGDIAKGNLFTAPVECTVREAAVIMSENHIGSLLLRDDEEKVVGIVTDKDIRSKVVAAGLDYDTRVERIMASPVKTISNQAICFDALLKMMKNQVHHLAIEKRGEIIRMITTHDIMVAQGTSPLYLFREIVAQKKISGLYPLSHKIQRVVHSMVEEGAKANNVTRMIAILNDHILERLLTLLIEEHGEPPLPFCWLLLGSEGRSEQTFKTDQDNAIIYADSHDPALMKQAEEYFREFSQKAIEHLVQCGYPLCPGEVMASNIKWRQPLSVWKEYFRSWCMTPAPKSVLHSTIFFDFRCGFGTSDLADDLRDQLLDPQKRIDLFFIHLAQNCLATRPPLTFFKNFMVEKDGEHKNTLDLKRKGLVFFVDFARLLALKYNISETNTLGRLDRLHENQYLSSELYTETAEAYEFLMHLRLVHQLNMIEEGNEPDNYIDPRDLSDLERKTTKEAFAVISRLQEYIRQEFHLTDYGTD